MKRERPALRIPLIVVVFLLISVLIEIERNGTSWMVWIAALAVAYRFVVWVSYPYSSWARKRLLPDKARFERVRRFDQIVRRIPILGSSLRWADRRTNNAGRRAFDEYEESVNDYRSSHEL